jgi:hypothetical protein
MKITIEQVANGYIVTTSDGKVFVASTLSGYSGTTLQEVMREIFTEKDEE